MKEKSTPISLDKEHTKTEDRTRTRTVTEKKDRSPEERRKRREKSSGTKPDEAGKAIKKEKAVKVDKALKTDKTVKADKAAGPDKTVKTDKAAKPKQAGKKPQTDKPAGADKSASSEKAIKSERRSAAEKRGKTERPKRKGKAERPDRPERRKTDRSNRSGSRRAAGSRKRDRLDRKDRKSSAKELAANQTAEQLMTYNDTEADLGVGDLRQELRRVKYNHKFAGTLYNTIGTLLVVAAAAILIANLCVPVLQVTGSSMTPTLEEGEILLADKNASFATGDVIAFYYNNKILVKRVIATSGDWVNIATDGTVYVNDIELDDPYVSELAFGDCDLTFPYQVPDSQIFVMGDHRSVSLDSRNSAIGCVAEEQVVGKVKVCIWPLNDIGLVQ